MMVHNLLLMATFALAQAAMPGDHTPPPDVPLLIRQLNAPQLAVREAAEAKLVELGPAILEQLPTADQRLAPETRQRLARIRQHLEQISANRFMDASRITLHAQNMPFGQVLQAIQKQSGNAADIAPRHPTDEPVLKQPVSFNFQAEPFWAALDKVFDQTGFDLYSVSDKPGLWFIGKKENPARSRFDQACYAGPFRFKAQVDPAFHTSPKAARAFLTVNLETAWEPRLQVIMLMAPMADVRAIDDQGRTLTAANPVATLEIPVDSSRLTPQWVKRIDLNLQAPAGEVQKIVSLKGKILATLAGRMETFRFDRLSDAKKIDKRIARVTVTLQEVRNTAQGCEVRLLVRYDDAGDALASHRQWIFANPAFLQTTDGKTIEYDTYETTAQTKNELGIAYQFSFDQPLDAVTFIYQTPGTILTKTLEYELNGIEFP